MRKDTQIALLVWLAASIVVVLAAIARGLTQR